ncbi:MAG: D-alanine--D-alanine ligase [Dysgonomonas sp.]|nr:D-alanine--D-alanine ligase [Dysgonomonas sp.]
MKKNVAIIWGGYSSEIVVSEKSMNGIYSFMDKEKYNIYKVKIDRNNWTAEIDGQQYLIDKNDFSIINNNNKINIDFAYITIHGTPGEDGHLQAYFDMLDIPYSSCGMTASALTFNKFICNNYLKNFGILVADSIYLNKETKYNIPEIANRLKLPIFIKPNTGGSSFATTKVTTTDKIQKAIYEAFNEGPDVIIESFIEGREVTCGCYKTNGNETIFPITEVITKNEFFDYNAKYNGEVEEITPANIEKEISVNVQKLTSKIYDLVGAKGLIRVDFIIKGDTPYLLEVNTTPGMTATSFIPQQVRAAGLDMTDVLTEIIEAEYNKCKKS